ncbi:MAG: glycosyltransferase family 2 protein [Pyrinomonadaceae bacterium]
MSTSFQGLTVVIPTRNRSDLARRAIQSARAQPGGALRVLVSDNSTEQTEIERLQQFCAQLKDARLQYVRPPAPLAMSAHWDWAVQQALRSDSSHFTILTDRMVFKQGQLKTVVDIARQYPAQIICYMHDKVHDFAAPFTVEQYNWTGKLYEVTAARLLTLAAESVIYDASTPRMLNCLVPRSVLTAIKERFGTIFASISPDWNFCYRALTVVDAILFFNKAVLVHYALNRSNGQSAERGIRNSDFEDFLKSLPQALNAAAPFPEIITVWNAIINEYCVTKRQAQSAKLPELNMEKYVQALAVGVSWIANPAVRREMEQKLLARGWQPTKADNPSLIEKLLSPQRVLNKFKAMIGWPKSLVFETPEQALEYAINNFKPRSAALPSDEAMHQGREMPIRALAEQDAVADVATAYSVAD